MVLNTTLFTHTHFPIRSLPANIRLGKDVLKTSWRHLEDVFSVTFFCLPRRLEDIIARRLANTSWRRLGRRLEDVLKTSWRRLGRHLEDVLKTSWRRFRKTYCKCVLKTSSRGLEDVLENKKCLLGTNLLVRYHLF